MATETHIYIYIYIYTHTNTNNNNSNDSRYNIIIIEFAGMFVGARGAADGDRIRVALLV